MRIPVFARRSNPAIDRPILKKSRFYAEQQVRNGRADWVDPDEPRKGIVCRELLNFGPRRVQLAQEQYSCSSDRALGVKFIGPPNPIPHFRSLLGPDAAWDWTNGVFKASAGNRCPSPADVAPTQNVAAG